MPKDKKFVNPLYQPTISTETATAPETLTQTQPATLPTTDASTLPPTKTTTEPIMETATFTSTGSEEIQHRKRGKEAFEQTHKRVTYWMEKRLNRRFEKCARDHNLAYSTLLEEAVKDVLKKYET